MNSKILVPQKTIGAITIKKLQGGETTMKTVFADIHHVNEEGLYGFESFALRQYGQELKEKRGKIPEENEEIRNSLTKRINAVYKVLNSRVPKKSRFNSLDNFVEYEIENLNESMIRQGLDFVYEIKNGDRMIMNKNKSKLKINDLLVLHNQGRLVVGKNNIPTNRLEGLKNEMLFIQHIDSIKEVCSVLLPTQKGKADKPHKLSEVNRISINKNHCKDENVYEWLRNRGGSKHEFTPILRWNEEDHYSEIVPSIVAFNNVDYSANHFIYIGRNNFIIDGLRSQNEYYGDYYDYIHKDSGERKIGLRNLSKDEKADLKQSKQKKGNPSKSEAMELIEIANAQDGRFNQFNLEHALRFELRHYKNRTSSELFYLINEIEENVDFTTEGLNGTKIVLHKKHQALLNVLKGFKGSVEIKEDETDGLTQDVKDLVTQESEGFRKDKDYKKGKNLYSQTLGVLTKNQNPWLGLKDLRSREQIFEPCILNAASSKEVRIRDEAEKMLIRTKKIKDAKGNPWETVELVKAKNHNEHQDFYSPVKRMGDEQLKERGLFNRGSSRFKFLLTSSSPSYRDVSKEEYHHHKVNVFYGPARPGASTPKVQDMFGFLNGVVVLPTSPKKVRAFESLFKFLDTPYTEEIDTRSRIKKVYETIARIETKALTEEEERFNRNKDEDEDEEREKCIFEYVVRTVTNLKEVFKGDLSTPFKPSLNRKRYNPHRVHVDYPLNFNRKVGWLNAPGKFRAYPIQKPTEGKNLGWRNTSISIPSYEILKKKNNIYQIKVDGVSKVLYAKGNLKALNEKSMSFAGIREPSRETINFITTCVCEAVNKGYVTVSGLAEGCDQIVHEDTNSSYGKTIAVIPTGFNHIYKNKDLADEIVREGGLLLSEYPPHVNGWKKDGNSSYHQRNEILVSLSEEVILFEAGRGTMSSFNKAKKLNKKILVQPINTANNRKMLNEGGEILLL